VLPVATMNLGVLFSLMASFLMVCDFVYFLFSTCWIAFAWIDFDFYVAAVG
jgi:hypothetical protein